MQTIYDEKGNAKQVDPVDAREHIEMGTWFNEAPEVVFNQTIQIDSKADVEAVQEVVKRAYNKRTE